MTAAKVASSRPYSLRVTLFQDLSSQSDRISTPNNSSRDPKKKLGRYDTTCAMCTQLNDAASSMDMGIKCKGLRRFVPPVSIRTVLDRTYGDHTASSDQFRASAWPGTACRVMLVQLHLSCQAFHCRATQGNQTVEEVMHLQAITGPHTLVAAACMLAAAAAHKGDTEKGRRKMKSSTTATTPPLRRLVMPARMEKMVWLKM